MLSEELGHLFDHLRELRVPAVQFLRAGVDRDRVVSVLGEVPPESVLEWFRWCNGASGFQGQIQDDVNIIPGYNPVSVEEAVRLKPLYADESALGTGWIPLLHNPGGDMYAAVWDGLGDAEVAAVLEGQDTEIEFESILDMVKYFNKCFVRRAFYLDNGWLAMDPNSSALIYDEMFAGLVGFFC